MKELPLNALRAFAAIHAHGGIRAAARELGVSHSAVSRHLKELETWLGVRLARQTGGRSGLLLTPQGDMLGKTVMVGFQDIANVVAALREDRSANSVTIVTTPSFASRWLLPRLPAFESAHRRIELSILVEQGFSDMDGGEMDFAIRMGNGPWPDLDCRPLMDDSLYPVMSPSYWREAGRPTKPPDLIRLRLLHDRDPQVSWEAWRREHGPEKLNVRKGPRLVSSDLLLRAAMQGQGMALARHRLADDDIKVGLLVRPVKKLSLPLGTSYWIVRSHRFALRSAAATVVEWLMEQAKPRGDSGVDATS